MQPWQRLETFLSETPWNIYLVLTNNRLPAFQLFASAYTPEWLDSVYAGGCEKR
jgi:hypothetical protein